MSNFIHSERFREVVEAAQYVGGYSETNAQYQSPSAALIAGGTIRCLAEIKQGDALEHSNADIAESCAQFLKLCDLNWSSEVSSVALRNIADRKLTGSIFHSRKM